MACKTLVKVLPAVIPSLEHEATERGDALAVGLSKVVKHCHSVASLCMCDVYYLKYPGLVVFFSFQLLMSSICHYSSRCTETANSHRW